MRALSWVTAQVESRQVGSERLPSADRAPLSHPQTAYSGAPSSRGVTKGSQRPARSVMPAGRHGQTHPFVMGLTDGGGAGGAAPPPGSKSAPSLRRQRAKDSRQQAR